MRARVEEPLVFLLSSKQHLTEWNWYGTFSCRKNQDWAAFEALEVMAVQLDQPPIHTTQTQTWTLSLTIEHHPSEDQLPSWPFSLSKESEHVTQVLN